MLVICALTLSVLAGPTAPAAPLPPPAPDSPARSLQLALPASVLPTAPVQVAPSLEEGGGWNHTVGLYLFGAGISGNVKVANNEVPVSQTFSDIWDNLD
jgi:hypothetical protein